MKNNKDEVKNRDEAIDRLKSLKKRIKEESEVLSLRVIAQSKQGNKSK